MGTRKKLNKYGLQEYSFEIGAMDDSDRTVAIVGLEYSSVSEDDKFYSKEDVDALIAEKDKEIALLKEHLSPDIADAAASPALRPAESLSLIRRLPGRNP